jgi:hypothetical protein
MPAFGEALHVGFVVGVSFPAPQSPESLAERTATRSPSIQPLPGVRVLSGTAMAPRYPLLRIDVCDCLTDAPCNPRRLSIHIDC